MGRFSRLVKTRWLQGSVLAKQSAPIIKASVKTYAERTLRMLTHPGKPVILGYIVFVSLLAIWSRCWNTLDVNSYYYSYSTIAQTLAGAFAFLVAVALFRMQSIESDMERAVLEVVPYGASANDQAFLSMKARSHQWTDIERYIHQQLIDAHPDDKVKTAVSTNWNTFKMSRDMLSGLKAELIATLRLTSIVIGSCFALIPVCQLLKRDRAADLGGSFFAMIFLLTVTILALRCLWRYWDIAKHLTDTKPRHIHVTARSHMTLGAAVDASGESIPTP